MEIALWIAQGLLAVLFLMAGTMKLRTPKSEMPEQMAWTEDFSDGTLKAIGGLEVAAAVGLIVPPLLGIAPTLAPLAAAGLVLLMIGAAVTHGRRGETQRIVQNAVMLGMAGFVAWGRFGDWAF